MKIFGTFLFAFLTAIFFNSFPHLALAAAPTDAVIGAAKSKHLDESRQWRKLLHIERNFLGVPSYQISGSKFLFSRTDLYRGHDELEATLLAFAEPADKYARVIEHPLRKQNGLKVMDHSEHPICRFPARLAYLKSELGDETSYWKALPQVNCVFQQIYLEALSPQGLSFVFSSYYANSPGSAFGHTFFRVKRQPENIAVKQELLDYGMSFAANVTVSNPVAYGVMGLFGGFTGMWANLPYYYKVREYNDYEARDLWSYDLNLQPEEIRMFAWHLWEIGGQEYTYYFFTQNCAYHMLTALEAAAPRLHLVEHVPFYYVIPADSMKALFYEPGFVKDSRFRPSARKVFLARVDRLDPDAFREFKKFVDNEEVPESIKTFSDERRALILDASMDLLDLRNPELTPESNRELYRKKEFLLSERAKVNFVSPPLVVPEDPALRPELSHGSSRAAVSYLESDRIKSGTLDYRFALHDLQDPLVGMPRLSELEFFRFRFRLLPNDLHFDEMNIFKVFNLSPVSFFENKSSWGFEMGVQNRPALCPPGETDCHLGGFLAKYGRSVSFRKDQTALWAMGTVNARYGARLSNKYYFAPGIEVGLLYRWNDMASVVATYDREYGLNRDGAIDLGSIEYRQGLAKDFSLGLHYRNQTAGATAYYYF